MIYLCLYLFCSVITAGVIGGVRDEMEGIGDMFVIAFWPAALIFLILNKIFNLFYKLGRLFK